MDELRIGDRVQRKSGKQTVGVIERFYAPNYYYPHRRAEVRWLDSFAKFGGGTRDHHSTIAVASLRRLDAARGQEG